jgi:hypothetical protein
MEAAMQYVKNIRAANAATLLAYFLERINLVEAMLLDVSVMSREGVKRYLHAI